MLRPRNSVLKGSRLEFSRDLCGSLSLAKEKNPSYNDFEKSERKKKVGEAGGIGGECFPLEAFFIL